VRRGDLSGAQGKLNLALKNLIPRWDDTKTVWKDSVARGFEKDHYEELTQKSTTAVAAMQRLGNIMHQAYRDCS
jgi:hypothetical protein